MGVAKQDQGTKHIACVCFQSTLEDMDMEDDMKTLVSDEIKRFRESYQVCFILCINTKKNAPKLLQQILMFV